MMAVSCNGREARHDFLPFLPRDIFWLVVGYLAPIDFLRCRGVSRTWNEAFGNTDILIPTLKKHFPWTQEAKDIRSGSSEAENYKCRRLFDKVVMRYHHLRRGLPRSIRRYRLCDDFGSSGEREWFQVQPWDLHASHIRQDVDRVFPEAMWTQEDGLVVYPSADHQCLVLLDLVTEREFMVPFIIRGKVVRRVRLQKRLLVIEWAEPKAFHWLNESDGVHRHFASSFDVTQNADGRWIIAPRNEWKIMFLGHPLSERDRFYSTHSNTHYVIYTWQPNRSLYTADEDAPIESLFVWDISRPSSYRPSIDPTGKQTGPEVDQAPCIVARYGFQDLEFIRNRQRGVPMLQRLDITDDGRSIEFSGNRAIVRNGARIEELGYPWTVITSIPVEGYGPQYRRNANGFLPPYRGDFTLDFVSEDRYLRDDTWYGIIAEVTDQSAGVKFCLHFDPVDYVDTSQTINLSIETRKSKVTFPTWDFAGRGKICGCERYVLGENRNRELIVYRYDR